MKLQDAIKSVSHLGLGRYKDNSTSVSFVWVNTTWKAWASLFDLHTDTRVDYDGSCI